MLNFSGHPDPSASLPFTRRMNDDAQRLATTAFVGTTP